MTVVQIIQAILESVEELRPTDYILNPNTRYKPGGSTGNMAFNSLQILIMGNVVRIYFNDGIAPYIPYTNEPWISPYWHGKKNPNQGWWDRFVQELIRRINQKIGGKIIWGINNDNYSATFKIL